MVAARVNRRRPWIRDRLTERNTAEAELRSKISKAIRQTVTADDADAIVEVGA
jgi:hypothetical protein